MQRRCGKPTLIPNDCHSPLDIGQECLILNIAQIDLDIRQRAFHPGSCQ